VTSIIQNNTIQCNNSFGAQGIGAGISQVPGVGNTPIMSVAVTNNNISATEGNGILIVARDCNGSLDCSVQNNTVDAPTGGVRPGIRIDAGNATGNVTVCTTITGNTSAGSGGSQGIGLRKQGTAPG